MDKKLAIINNMKQLGFSEYESKAYFKLLEDFPLTGYTLAKKSGVPRSRIYDVLENLINQQMIFVQEEEKNKLYYPVEPDILINKFRTKYENLFSKIFQFAGSIYNKEKQDEKVVVIKGRQSIMDFINILIKGAEKRIAMSIWKEEIDDITEELDKALKRGVVLKGIYFGGDTPYETLVSHRRSKRHLSVKKKRYISIIIDGTHTISGIVSRDEDSKVTWTQDEGFVELSEDYIAHDLALNLYSGSLDKKRLLEFERFIDGVYKEYFDYSDEEFSLENHLK